MKKLYVDISEHNGNVDIAKMKASGVQGVIIRSSWGHFVVDKQLANNVRKCKECGMPFGLYHYSYADTHQNAMIEAVEFNKLINQHKPTLPVALDMEDADHWKEKNGVTDAMNLVTISVFKEVIEKSAGHYLMLYMSKSWFDRLTPLDPKLINSLDKWLAHWGIGSPSLECGIWQFSSKGQIAGSSARTDVNFCYKDYEKIIQDMYAKRQNQAVTPPQSTALKVGDNVRVRRDINYNGVNLDDWVLQSMFRVMEINGDRVVLGRAGQVTDAFNIKDVVKV